MRQGLSISGSSAGTAAQQIEPGRPVGGIGRQRQVGARAAGARWPRSAQPSAGFRASLPAMRCHEPARHRELVELGQASLPPSRVEQQDPVAGAAEDAAARRDVVGTIQSQPLRASLARACASGRRSRRRSRSPAPGDRPAGAALRRMSGFSTSSSAGGGAPFRFFSLRPGAGAGRQSATAAAQTAMSAGSAASHRRQHLARRLDVHGGDAGRVGHPHRAR